LPASIRLSRAPPWEKIVLARLIDWAETGRLPDALVRLGVRRMVDGRARRAEAEGAAAHERFVAGLADAPIALHADDANVQHYEVPADFFRAVLGPRLKYSGCWYDRPDATLREAEEAMLARTVERAGLADGMRVLDLGCGWGSLSLWIAERFPRCEITAVSNSKLQRESILADARARGLDPFRVETADVNVYAPEGRFDRVVSVEMVEHVRNWPRLLGRVASWLEPEGRAFVHHFCHREFAYPYEIEGDGDWMARHFFTGGMMPSADLLSRFDRDLEVVERWDVDGTHYARTSEDWLRNLDAARDALEGVLRPVHGPETARALGRWRLFFMGCAELFAHDRGRTWGVTHQLLAPRSDARR
jgi:cyclopropane-fatty-acyl-phospholipid synthase